MSTFDLTKGSQVKVRALYWEAHEFYANFQNDIGLVYLSAPVEGIRPVRLGFLQNGQQLPQLGESVLAMGFGRTYAGQPAGENKNLRQVELPVVDTADCNKMFTAKISDSLQFCVGGDYEVR